MHRFAGLFITAIFLSACGGGGKGGGATAAPSGVVTAPGSPAVASGSPAAAATGFPNSNALLNSQSDDNDWLIAGKTYAGNRLTGLTQITPANVAGLKKAWQTAVADDGEEEASPIVWDGVVYLTTAHNNILALDGTTGKLKWAFGYTPSYELQYAVNRGVGFSGGNVYIVTEDCRLIAVDAATGRQRFNVSACHDTSNTWYSTAAYVYKNEVIVGTSGGDLGGSGLVSAFDANTGKRLWDWHTVAQPGQPGHDTWPGDSWVHGGAAVWAGLAIDQTDDTVYAAPGNPGPNLTLYGRKGKNLYANSVVSLSGATSQPSLKWYYQIIANDTHDADPAMPPVLFDATVAGSPRKLLAVADKAGDFVILDRTTGKQVYRTIVSNQVNLNIPPTTQGVHACPNHGGGVEWNGGSYSPQTNMFYIPSTNECATWKIIYTGAVPYIPGQPYTAGPLPKRQNATGLITAIDLGTGKVTWRDAVPYPAQGGVLVQKNGLIFTSDLRGRIYALDAKTGKDLWHDDTGSAIVAPISAYRGGDGNEYLVVITGEAGNQQTPNLPKSQGSRVVAYRLNVSQPIANDTTGQPSVRVATSGGANKTESGNAPTTIASGTVPYTSDQVATGQKVYQTSCSSCHGASLQGVSAPALTGPQFAHANLTVSQIYSVVTKQMPLNAPGSLSPDNYAAVMAYILKHDCVKPSGATQKFPSTNTPALGKVTVGSQTCP